MYLSLLEVNIDASPGRLWIRNIYHVHQRLCMAFPSSQQKETDPEFIASFNPEGFQHVHDGNKPRSGEQSFLFRIDPLPPGRAMITVQSAISPDWEYAFQNARYLLTGPPKTIPFTPTFNTGQTLKFRLAANPTKRLRKDSIGPDGNPVQERWIGKRVPVPTNEMESWLSLRASNGGFSVEHLNTVQTGYAYFSKRRNESQTVGTNSKHEARLRQVIYEGDLKITESDVFSATLIKGIGSAKGFGFGLLSVAPLRSGNENTA